MKTSALVLGGLLLALPAWTQTLQDWGRSQGAQAFWDPYRNTVFFTLGEKKLAIDLASGQGLAQGEVPFVLTTLDPAAGTLGEADRRILDAAWAGAIPDPGPSPGASVPSPVPAEPPSTGPRIQVIVLDAGHGGSDPGSIGRHTIDGQEVVLQEKDLTLAVVLEVQRLLNAAYPDRRIVLTRSGDTYPTLERRVQVAHAQKLGDHDSIVFLSVHFNASLSRQAQGLEFWYVPHDYEREVIAEKDIPDSIFPVLNTLVDAEYKKESRSLAVALDRAVAGELPDGVPGRGLKENPWFVVRMARMPAVLAELGFITNPEEASRLRDPAYLNRLARGLYNGLAAFIRDYEDHP